MSNTALVSPSPSESKAFDVSHELLICLTIFSFWVKWWVWGQVNSTRNMALDSQRETGAFDVSQEIFIFFSFSVFGQWGVGGHYI
jgi:hypothetical protein